MRWSAGEDQRIEPGHAPGRGEADDDGGNGAYWDAHWSQYLRFYADALTAC